MGFIADLGNPDADNAQGEAGPSDRWTISDKRWLDERLDNKKDDPSTDWQLK